MKPSLIILCALLASGCHSYDVNGTVPVRYAKSVNVIQYDNAVRPVSPSIQLFDDIHQPPVSYITIASLSHEGYRHDEQLIIGALEWRARQLGANGLILVDAKSGEYHPGFAFATRNGFIATEGSTQPIFRGIAILYKP